MRANAASEYAKLVRLLKYEAEATQEGAFEELLKTKAEEYGVDTASEIAEDEAIAAMCENMLRDGSLLEMLRKNGKHNRPLIQRVVDLLDRIISAFSRRKDNESFEADEAAKLVFDLRKVRRQWSKALEELQKSVISRDNSLDTAAEPRYNTTDKAKENDHAGAEDEFRRIQAESLGISDADRWDYQSGCRVLDEKVRGLLSRVFGRRLAAERGRHRYASWVLTNPKSGRELNLLVGVSARTFHDIFEIVYQYLPYGFAVDVHPVKSTQNETGYEDCTNYLSEDGLCGFSVAPDGNLISVFNIGEAGFLKTIAPILNRTGAKKLDCHMSVKGSTTL